MLCLYMEVSDIITWKIILLLYQNNRQELKYKTHLCLKQFINLQRVLDVMGLITDGIYKCGLVHQFKSHYISVLLT